MCQDCESHSKKCKKECRKHRNKQVCETEVGTKKVWECVKVPRRVTKTVWKKVVIHKPVQVSKIIYVDKKVEKKVPCERKVKRCVRESKYEEDLCPCL